MVAFSRGSFIYITKSAQLCCIQSPARPTRPSACLPSAPAFTDSPTEESKDVQHMLKDLLGAACDQHGTLKKSMLQDFDHAWFCIAVNTIHMIIIPIHNATRERERERESHPTKYPQRPRSPALKLQPAPSYGNSPDVQLRSEATALEHRSTLAPIQQPTIAQNDSNPRMSLQHSKSSPTCARQFIIPWVTRSGAANRVPFLQRTRPRHAQPGERSPHTRCVLHTEIASTMQLRSVALDTQTCASNGDSGVRSMLGVS
jgi:hypothetical protein